MGVLPTVTVKELDVYEPGLYATTALEFLGIQDCIAKMLCADKKNFLLFTSRLLNIANRINHDGLKWSCYYEFFYRVRPLSLSECADLGTSDLATITHVRELVRDEIWNLTRTDVETSKQCKNPGACSQVILVLVRQQMRRCNQASANGSIFDVSESSNLCSYCDSRGPKLAGTCRVKRLDEKVRKWVSALQPHTVDGNNSE